MAVLETYIVYLIIFRVVVIAAGLISILLGYRLFVLGVWPSAASGGTAVQADVVGARLNVKNAAPGTCFALFGVIIIAVMLVTGSPQMTVDNLGDAQKTIGPLISEGTVTKGDSASFKPGSGVRVVLRDHTISRISSINKELIRKDITCEEAYSQLYRLINDSI